MNTSSVALRVAAALSLLSFSAPGLAATRTVCFQLEFADARTDCPQSFVPGNLRPCERSGTTQPAVGHIIELWDKDDASNDDYIGTFVKSNQGRGCATFEWEGALYSGTESDPDVYIKYVNRVVKSDGSGAQVQGLTTAEVMPPAISSRDGTGVDPDAWVAVNCQAGQNCEIAPGVSLVTDPDHTSYRAERVMALDTAQHALEVFGGLMTTTVDMVYPWDCLGTGIRCISHSDGDDMIRLYGRTAATNGYTPAHEVGHALQKQLFGTTWLRNDCSLNGDGHSLQLAEYESCATAEGFADFVAVASWWDNYDQASRPFMRGGDFEQPDPINPQTCDGNKGRELMVARGFWDLVDANNEDSVFPASGNDTHITSKTYAASGWKDFNRGTANRKYHEGDEDGVNARDFHHNAGWRYDAGSFDSMLRHNCLDAQDDG